MSDSTLPSVLVCDPIHADGLAMLRQYAAVDVVAGPALDDDALTARIREGGYAAIVTRSRTKVPAAVIAGAPNLRVIGRAGVGLDTIDVAAAAAHGVRVVNAPDASTTSVAEHVFALMLALARRVPQADRSMKAGEWAKKQMMGTSLAGKTLGIVGFGRIGRQVARQARPFGLRLIVNQPRLTPELILAWNIEQFDLLDLLAEADFVTLHVPFRPETTGLIGADELARMKPTAHLINTARGGIVDEAALLAALVNGRLAGAGLDVFAGEPDVNQALVGHPAVVATPHIGASTEDAQRQAAVTTAEQVLRILR